MSDSGPLDPSSWIGKIVGDPTASGVSQQLFLLALQEITRALKAQTQSLAPSGGVWVNRQIFTGSGTYTPTSSIVTLVDVILIGGGAAGGGAAITAPAQYAMGPGGGAGGLARKRLTAGFAGTLITIGAAGTGVVGGAGNGGGQSLFGAILTANGGDGGQLGISVGGPGGGFNGGLGGTAVGGDINLRGGPGGPAAYIGVVSTAVGGAGGNTPLGYGMGARSVLTQTTGTGEAGSGFGSAGGGGVNGASQAAVAGGAGTPGLCIIDEYR